MGKAIKEFAQKTGLTFDSVRDSAYGRYQGYYTVISARNKQEMLISVPVKAQEPENEGALREYITTLTQGRPAVIFARYENRAIQIGLRSQANAAKDIAALEELLSNIAGYLQTNGFISCCRLCGADQGLGITSINGHVDTLCQSCFEQVAHPAQPAGERLEMKKKPKGNLLTGAIGAILGSFVGAVLWVLIYQLGFIAGIAGIAMLACAVWGYQKLGGKLTAGGVYIAILCSIVMLFVAENICVIIEFFKVFKEINPGISLGDIDFGAVIQLAWSEPEIRGAMAQDLVVGYGLAALCGIPYAIQMLKGAKTKEEAVRLA